MLTFTHIQQREKPRPYLRYLKVGNKVGLSVLEDSFNLEADQNFLSMFHRDENPDPT